MNFVSEEELKKQREAGEERPESSEPVDNRPLYNRLKEQRDKKQLEYDETHALKNQFRGIDEAEADFLSQVDRAKAEQEARKRKEEQELLQMSRQQTTTEGSGASDVAGQQHHTLLAKKPQKAPVSSGTNRQAALVASFVRKRPLSTDHQSKSVSEKVVLPSQSSTKCPADPPPKLRYESHCQVIGVLPGLPNYSDSSDEAESSSNSESLESELPCVAIYAGKGAPKQQGGSH